MGAKSAINFRDGGRIGPRTWADVGAGRRASPYRAFPLRSFGTLSGFGVALVSLFAALAASATAEPRAVSAFRLGATAGDGAVWTNAPRANAASGGVILSPDDRSAPVGAELQIGAGAIYAPVFEGASDYELSPFPLIALEGFYGFALEPFKLTHRSVEVMDPEGLWSLRAGPQIELDRGRDADQSDFLDGLGDVDPGLRLGGFAEGRIGPVFAAVDFGQDIADGPGGALVKTRLGLLAPISERLFTIASGSVAWASDAHMQSYFGVDQAQASQSGYAQYDAEAGIKDAGVDLTVIYGLSDDWRLTARAGYHRLLGDAADSPLVQGSGGSADQFSSFIGVSRVFDF